MYKVGDRVRIADNLKVYNAHFVEDDVIYEPTGLLPEMLQYNNAVGVIVQVVSDGHEYGYILDVDNSKYIWFEEFLEIIED